MTESVGPKGSQEYSCCGIPKLDSFVIATTGKRLTVRAKNNGRNNICVTNKRMQPSAASQIPDPNYLVISATSKHTAVRADFNVIRYGSDNRSQRVVWWDVRFNIVTVHFYDFYRFPIFVAPKDLLDCESTRFFLRK